MTVLTVSCIGSHWHAKVEKEEEEQNDAPSSAPTLADRFGQLI